MPISLRRVREYFEEIVERFALYLYHIFLSVLLHIYHFNETSLSRRATPIWEDLRAVVVVGGGGSSFRGA